MPPIVDRPSGMQLRTASNLAIAAEVTAAMAATEGHSQIALSVAIMAKQHKERFGEPPQLRNLVSATHWPIVIVANPVGIARVVTRYIITAEGEVSLERSYTKTHIHRMSDSNVFTSIPPSL